MIKPVSLNSVKSLPKNIYSHVENLGATALGAAKKGGNFIASKDVFQKVASQKNAIAGTAIILAGVASLVAITKGVVNKIQELKAEK